MTSRLVTQCDIMREKVVSGIRTRVGLKTAKQQPPVLCTMLSMTTALGRAFVYDMKILPGWDKDIWHLNH